MDVDTVHFEGHTEDVNNVNIMDGDDTMIDIQLLNDALLTLGFIVGLVIAVSIAVVASAALWQRYERKAGVRKIEQHLSLVAADDSRAAAG